ncbi:MAG: alcohol dehydrogenase catalytic domain-containing protein [Candidatus Xenobia bacterium]
MKAAVMKRYGGLEAVEVREVPEPGIQHDEVLVEVQAAGLNPVDLKILHGKMWPIYRYRFPAVLGEDVAGNVVKVGSGVTRWKVGDEALAHVASGRTRGQVVIAR